MYCRCSKCTEFTTDYNTHYIDLYCTGSNVIV